MSQFPMRDGLGVDMLQTGSLAGMSTQNAYFTGSVAVNGALSTAGALTAGAGGANITGSLVVSADGYYSKGSPYNVGWITIPLTARSNISGGMWVSCSGGLAMAAAALTKAPLGVAAATAASGATVNVIIRGVVPMVSEGTILVEGGCQVGAGGALNTVKPHVAGSALFYPTLSSAGSEATVFVVL